MTDEPDWTGDAYKALAESLDRGVVELTADEKRLALLNAMLEKGSVYDDIKFWVEEARKSIEIEKKVLAAFVATFGEPIPQTRIEEEVTTGAARGEQGRVAPQAIAENIVDSLYKNDLSIVTYTGGAFGHWPVDDEHAIKLIAKIIEQFADAPSSQEE